MQPASLQQLIVCQNASPEADREAEITFDGVQVPGTTGLLPACLLHNSKRAVQMTSKPFLAASRCISCD